MESRYCGTSVPWYMPPYRPALFVHRKLFYVSTIVGFANVVALVITFFIPLFLVFSDTRSDCKTLHYDLKCVPAAAGTGVWHSLPPDIR